MSALAIARHSTQAQVPNRRSLRALEWTNFFLADVQAALGPFVAAYLAGLGWQAGAVGRALTFGGIITVLLQTPAGWIVDRAPRKRLILVAGTLLLALGAILLARNGHVANVYSAQTLIGLAAPFLGPTIAAITMGVTGPALFDLQFGRNQGFNAAGNLFAAAVIALVSHLLGSYAIFYRAAALSLPTVVAALCIRKNNIDLDLARGARPDKAEGVHANASILQLARDRVLLAFLVCARTRGSGQFNLAQGALATAVGLGAAFSNSFGGTLMEHSGYRASFLALGFIAGLAFSLLLLAIPETRDPLTSKRNAIRKRMSSQPFSSLPFNLYRTSAGSTSATRTSPAWENRTSVTSAKSSMRRTAPMQRSPTAGCASASLLSE